MNGAAASAASPIGSEAASARDRRQQRRDQGGRHPDADRCDRIEGEIAPDRALLARRREQGRPDHEHLEAARPACEVSCRARRWVRRRVSRD
jgi:hypothetical protein